MPPRRTPLVQDHFYHIINRGVASIPIFRDQRDFNRFLDVINYYRFQNTPLPFSKVRKLSVIKRKKIFENLKKQRKLLVEVTCFCLMPNHFHFLLRQVQKDGISIFLKNSQDSYGKYFNTKYKRIGPLFQHRFKAILVENDNQLLHLSRYIHLNPYSSLVIRKKEDLVQYPWSSFSQYLGVTKGFCKTKIVLNQFKTSQNYQNFVFDQADYQRELERIKHLLLE